MSDTLWMDVHVQVRRMYNLLGETESLSQQLAEAVDRNDQVMIQMVLAMREEPLRALTEGKHTIEQLLSANEGPEADRLRALLNGAQAEHEAEESLVNQIGANGRLLRRVRELDRVLSEKIAREKSYYQGKNSSSSL